MIYVYICFCVYVCVLGGVCVRGGGGEWLANNPALGSHRRPAPAMIGVCQKHLHDITAAARARLPSQLNPFDNNKQSQSWSLTPQTPAYTSGHRSRPERRHASLAGPSGMRAARRCVRHCRRHTFASRRPQPAVVQQFGEEQNMMAQGEVWRDELRGSHSH